MWLTEAAQSSLEERLAKERNQELKIEPLTKTKLSNALQEICAQPDFENRKELTDENLNDLDER